jgi:hypothetical protein
MNKSKKLSKKELGFVKDYVKHGNGFRAIKNNYDTTNDIGARAMSTQMLAKEKIQRAIAERLPDDLLEEKHLALLNKMDNDSPDNIDVQAVSKGLDMAYKIKGSYAAEKKDVSFTGVVIDSKMIELAQRYEEELKQGL